jgi:hypothetical protein
MVRIMSDSIVLPTSPDVPVRSHTPIIPLTARRVCDDDCLEFAEVMVSGPTPAQDQHLCQYHAQARSTSFARVDSDE